MERLGETGKREEALKPKRKRVSHCFDPWTSKEYSDHICYGRDVTFNDYRPRPVGSVRFSRQEWIDMIANTAWYNEMNPLVLWDKPKKELLDNWKLSGRLMMGNLSKEMKRRK